MIITNYSSIGEAEW